MPDIKIGSTSAKDIRVGNNSVKYICKGTTPLWSRTFTITLKKQNGSGSWNKSSMTVNYGDIFSYNGSTITIYKRENTSSARNSAVFSNGYENSFVGYNVSGMPSNNSKITGNITITAAAIMYLIKADSPLVTLPVSGALYYIGSRFYVYNKDTLCYYNAYFTESDPNDGPWAVNTDYLFPGREIPPYSYQTLNRSFVGEITADVIKKYANGIRLWLIPARSMDVRIDYSPTNGIYQEISGTGSATYSNTYTFPTGDNSGVISIVANGYGEYAYGGNSWIENGKGRQNTVSIYNIGSFTSKSGTFYLTSLNWSHSIYSGSCQIYFQYSIVNNKNNTVTISISPKRTPDATGDGKWYAYIETILYY